MARRLPSIGLLALLLASDAHAETSAPPCTVTRGDTRAVARIVDGETLLLDDGRRVRLIGALAPRAGDVGAEPGSWPPESETRATLATLAEGKSISLWHDRVREDRYGQVLAQVMVGIGADAAWLQGALVERGLSRAYGRPGVDACSEALGRIERDARESRRGLWANAAYQPRDADDETGIVRAVGHYQVLTGTVHRISRGQGGVYLSLAPRRGRSETYAVAAVVPGSRTDLTGGTDTRAFANRRVLLRGWVEFRRGPVIIVDSKGQLELVED
jgi:endonuclease YncB( thermonuclease family)